MSMAMKRDDLKKLSNNELKKKYDELANNTMVGINYFTEEILRRKQEKDNTWNRWLSICSLIIALAAFVVALVK